MSRLLNPDEVEKYRDMIKHYAPGDEVLDTFKKSNFVIIAGTTGAGKDTLRDNLIARYPEYYVPILSTTTRPPRPGEQDGVTYHFKEVEEFEQGLIDQTYFQAELVHDQQLSGLDISEIHKLESGQFGLSILITMTERKLALLKPDITTVFVVPPDLETLMDRLRGKRTLEDAEVGRRIKAASVEFEDALASEHYYCLLSDTVDHVVERAHTVLKGGYADPAYNQEADTYTEAEHR